MKKLLFIVFMFFYIGAVFANDELDIKANIDGGNYDSVLEIYLIPNQKEAKSFYYTDGIGEMNNIFEFNSNNPIIIKNNTTLNFFGTSTDYISTKIKENNYKITYSDEININFSKNEIILKNNSSKVLNIGYRKIKSNNIEYTIPKNTFIETNDYYKINYIGTQDELLELYSPDESKKSEIKIDLKQEIKNNNLKNKPIFIKKENNVENSQPQEQQETGSTTNQENQDNNNSQNQEIIQSGIINNQNQVNFGTNGIFYDKSNSLNIDNNIKSSVIDNKKDNTFYIFIGVISIIFVFSTAYNSYNLLKTKKDN